MDKVIATLLIGPSATVRDAIEAIDKGRRQVALVADENRVLLGTVTDGDIRRGLLRGIGLDAAVTLVMNPKPTVISRADGVDAARRLMREKSLHHVPVVDEQGSLLGMAWINDPAGPVVHSTKVILMAGGLGKRLRPLTDHTPKPMLHVGNRPLLENIIQSFRKQGFYSFTICLNYKGDMIRNHFGNGAAFNCEIEYIEEKEQMGTAGALSLLSNRPKDPFIVMNGDLLTSTRFDMVMNFHRAENSVATVCAREFSMQVPYGVLRTHGKNLVTIEEKPTETYQVSAGIYVLSPQIFDFLKVGQPLDMPGLLAQLVESELPVGVFPIREYWVDIGRIEDLDRARNEFHAVFGS